MDIAELTMKLCSASGPSGFEDEAAKLVSELVAPYVDEVYTDVMGSVIAIRRCGREGAPRIMLEAHIDEIGLVVTGYEKGSLRFNTLGGIDPRMLPAKEIKIMTEPPLTGVISVMPPHALSHEDMDKSLEVDKLYIDIGLESDEEARAAVPVGTPCVYGGEPFRLGENAICAKALDDRACAAIIIKTMENLAGIDCGADIICLFAVQEEIGLRGATVGTFAAAPQYAIALDVTFGNQPDVAAHKTMKMGGGGALGLGPNFNRALADKLRACADANELPLQIEVASGHSGTDAWSIQISREGVATALVSLPIKYMHTPVETMLISDSENIVKLLTEFLAKAGEVL